MARQAGAETLSDEDKDVQEKLRDMTKGQGAGSLHRCRGLEAHGAADAYKTFQEKADHCIKVVLKPQMAMAPEQSLASAGVAES